ncbi:exocyst complex component SEC8 isoform X2 [Physcomitrium patens]|uniref:Exocyst complex component Sec8 n=2 Tax=Physcomitrium patens TaxID=3218 RepID=A0A2K1J9U9_PHYPA|nr:exocyst complex component SEC8-like [Physcomitrium patens]PNR38301.1 hypothetical protein PHYPA_021412 [Physcomitrium patens]|eukprot:XP_024398346.1 exocyst complex component SEC8-like [Physcomitrella patens]
MTTGPSGLVDWNVVKKELQNIDDVWKQPRFDSLPHVVGVLTSRNPEVALEKLREQRDAIEELVDDVVRIYHNGFNKAIHNYSQILRLFSESAGSINGLKDDLGEARRLLGARHKQLHQQWCRSVTLRHVITLLDQIDKVAQVPARIEKLISEKRYYSAVQLHLHSISMLDREGIQSVGALQDVRSELSKLRGVLFHKVVEDLHLHLYNKGEYSVNLAAAHDQDDDISNIAPAVVPTSGNVTMSRRTRTMRQMWKSGLDRVLEARRAGSVDGSSVDGDNMEKMEKMNGENEQSEATNGNRGASNGNDDGISKDDGKLSRVAPVWLAESTPNEFTEYLLKSDAPQGVKYLQTMVECLALLGKITAAGSIISQRLRPTVHDMITAEIKARAAAIEAARPRVDEVSKLLKGGSIGVYLSQNGKNGSILITGQQEPTVELMGKAQTAARDLLLSILDLVTHILENHVLVGELMEAKANVGDHGGAYASPGNGNFAWLNDADISGATGGYSLGFALTVIQSECQQLICDILRATPDAASADAAVQTARLASKADPHVAKKRHAVHKKDDASLAPKGASEEGLSFAFRFTDTVLSLPEANDRLSGEGLRSTRNRRTSNASQEGYGTSAVLPERGIYLTSAVYRPILQFTDKVVSLLPKKYANLGNEGLQSFIENFVKDQFLPIVYVDYRTRVADALASPSAFRLKAHPGAVYEPALERGRPVLHGPLAANQLITEVLGWAQAMPMYAGEILELVQTLLERTLERCRAAYTEAVLGSLSSSVIGRPDIANLMKQEPANTLLDAAYLLQLGQRVNVDGPYDMEGLEVEMELNNLLLSLRPIKQEQLITDNHKLVLLAALSDSLDFLSESAQQLGQRQPTTPASPMKRKSSVHRVHHHRRTSSVLTAGLGILAEKYSALSAECLRTLRVEMQLEAIYHLQSMAGRVYVTDQDAEEPEDFIVGLTTQIARRDEEMAAYVPPLKRSYIFGGICSVSATAFIKSLHEMKSVNMLGVRQICRNCIALQQALASLAASSGQFLEERLDRVRTYFECLNLPFEALHAFVLEHDALFSFSEYSALLKVNVPGRDVPPDAVQRIGRILAPGKY